LADFEVSFDGKSFDVHLRVGSLLDVNADGQQVSDAVAVVRLESFDKHLRLVVGCRFKLVPAAVLPGLPARPSSEEQEQEADSVQRQAPEFTFHVFLPLGWRVTSSTPKPHTTAR